jgi:hypothetical protein
MTLPGFTAEAALSKTHVRYSGTPAFVSVDVGIQPAQLDLVDVIRESVTPNISDFRHRCWIIGQRCQTFTDYSTGRDVTLCRPVIICS